MEEQKETEGIHITRYAQNELLKKKIVLKGKLPKD